MRFEGGRYVLIGGLMRGVLEPHPTVEISSADPVETHHVVSCWQEGRITDLTPFAAAQTKVGGRDLLLLDGARTSRSVVSESALSYRSLRSGERVVMGGQFTASALVGVLR